MSVYQYKKYLFKLRKYILLNTSNEVLYKLVKYVNTYGNKIYSLEEYIRDTNEKYILSKSGKNIIPKDSIYGKCIELYGYFEISKYQKLYRTFHRIPKKYNLPSEISISLIKETLPLSQKEYTFFRNLNEGNIHGICFSCGDTTFFTDSHHIIGRKYNDMELSICIRCHYTYRGKNHCINIGNKIEKLFS